MTKTDQYKFWGNCLKLGFRYAKRNRPLSACILTGEELRWFRSGYLSYQMIRHFYPTTP